MKTAKQLAEKLDIRATASQYDVHPFGWVSLSRFIMMMVGFYTATIGTLWTILLLIGVLLLSDYLINREVNNWVRDTMRLNLHIQMIK